MQNSMQKFRQSYIVFEKPGYLCKKLKTLRSTSSHRVAEFFVTSCIYFAHISHLPMSTKGIFLFCLVPELFVKIKKDLVFTHSKVQQKILNSMVVRARQSFQCFRQITWFLENYRALLKFRHRILHYLISIIKLQKNPSVKAKLILTTQATLINSCICARLVSISKRWLQGLKFRCMFRWLDVVF